MLTKNIVRLSGEERQKLETLVKQFKGTSQTVKRAIVLLKADADGPNWTNEQIRELTGLSIQAIVNIRKQLVLEGFDVVLDRKNVACRLCRKNLTGCKKQNSWQHIAVHRRKLHCSKHCDQWSLRFLAIQTVVLEIVDSVSHETVRQTLKKTV